MPPYSWMFFIFLPSSFMSALTFCFFIVKFLNYLWTFMCLPWLLPKFSCTCTCGLARSFMILGLHLLVCQICALWFFSRFLSGSSSWALCLCLFWCIFVGLPLSCTMLFEFCIKLMAFTLFLFPKTQLSYYPLNFL